MSAEPELPAEIGGFRVVRRIGRGGMGDVLLAEHPRLGSMVAIKLLARERVEGIPHLAERFEREARTAARISHPAVVRVTDIGEVAGTLFMVMEYVDGVPLSDRLKHGPLPVPLALDLAQQAAEGLAAAHEIGVIHRDVKPANLMLEGGQRLRLVDFGIAHALDQATALTQTGQLVGTPRFMAPEQLDGEATIDGRVDVFALGGVLYEMLTGERAFGARSIMQVITQVRDHVPPPPSSLRAEIPPAVDALVARAMAKHPDQRFPTMEALARALAELRGGEQPIAEAQLLEGPTSRYVKGGETLVEALPPAGGPADAPTLAAPGQGPTIRRERAQVTQSAADRSPAPTAGSGASGAASAVDTAAGRLDWSQVADVVDEDDDAEVALELEEPTVRPEDSTPRVAVEDRVPLAERIRDRAPGSGDIVMQGLAAAGLLLGALISAALIWILLQMR